MFDATRGAAVSAEIIDDLSDQFAADFKDFLGNPAFTRQTKEDLIKQFATVMANGQNAQAFATGTYNQALANDGSPAAALGSGTTGSTGAITPLQALQAILTASDTVVAPGIKAFIRRGMTTSDPDYIQVGSDGTPKDISVLQNEVRALKDKLTRTEQTLAAEQDKGVTGSLAQRLEAATAATLPLPPTDMVKKSEVKAQLAKLSPLANAKQARMSRTDVTVNGAVATDLVDAYNALNALAS